jgi:hypothetical protein
MLSSIHNRFFIATETKFGAIPPTYLSKVEEKENEPDLSIVKENIIEMEEIVENVPEEIVVENMSITQCEVPAPIEVKEIEDEVFEKVTPVSNNPLFNEPPDFVLDDIYMNCEDDFEEQKPAKKKRSVLKTFMNEFKPTYRKKAKKGKSVL